MTNLRIGHGYDVHRLTEGRRLVLGGVEIPWDRGLLGHSDADVLTHAVMDALCGAAKLGDIGKLFPDSDPRYAGISSLELLAVQDGARPLVTPELIDDVAEQAARCGAAAPAVAVKDTIKSVREDGTVAETLDRSVLRAVQTPQIFEGSLVKAALQAAVEGDIPVTDDCSAVERLGKRVYLVDGDEENLKITTPVDLILAEAILRDREERL